MGDFNFGILQVTAHRRWPVPARPWVMTQTWHDLLFAHWALDPAAVRARVPRAFDLDIWEGHAWIGVVPFHMSNVAPRGVPALPWLSRFPEINVRTYVRVGDRPGVLFFSLDAGRALAVGGARLLFNLPYFTAAMTVRHRGAGVAYTSRRLHGRPAEFVGTYSPAGASFEAAAGSLEYFLTERYCLYQLDHRGRPYRMEIHHPPWPLQAAEAQIQRSTMADAAGFTLAGEPLLHFAARQDVVAWAPERLEA